MIAEKGVLGTAITGLKTLLGNLSGAFKALWAVAKAHPFVALITIISSVVISIISLYNKSEEFRNLLSDIWENTPGWDLVGFANGTTSAPGGLAMVGENGPELRVLGQGDGVIPADITRNLWDWGKINPSNLAARAVSYMFNIDNLSLPNARDAVSLVDGLKQMAYQRAYKRA